MIKCLVIIFGLAALSHAQFLDEEPNELIFKSCVLPQWECVNETNELSSYVSKVFYTCESKYTTVSRYEYDSNYGGHRQKAYNVATPAENITLDLSNWTKWTLKALTFKNCYLVNLRMHTHFDSNIDKLILSDINTLYVQPPKTTGHSHHPNSIFFKNIQLIPELPTHAMTDNRTEEVVLQDVKQIDSINKEAINLHGPVKTFTLQNVTIGSIRRKSISVTMDPNSKFQILSSNFPVLQFNSVSVKNGSVVISNSTFPLLQEASIVIKAISFSFINNKIHVNVMNALFVETPHVIIKGNVFSDVGHAVEMVHVNGFGYKEHHEEITFYFMENFTNSPVSEPSFCTSNSSAFINTGNCTMRASVSKYFEGKDNPKDVMLHNLLVCDNKFDIEIPSEWFPKTKTKLCDGQEVSTSDW